MARRAAAILVLGASLLAGGACWAQTAGFPNSAPIVLEEPPEGQMAPGMVLLVDDGSCGKGKVKQVTGGEIAGFNARPRTRKCVARPAR
ncbi:hypothetical protein CI1B_38010 [Bradyrhizobium ivorense]|uniref:Secreted protein n=1 Tax=Bradyrhizobium ivorense TaxID=2511166 RepID=A0A508TCK6_9BRAD|nr:DUF6719 family protein [Bradyrhizobium ivorense]VIO71614.1 hypothetical protein CI1B_38010 [Bradyrhizobium ivorense]